MLLVLYPLVFIISASISDPVLVTSGQMWLFPRGITFEGYKRVFQSSDIMNGFKNTVTYTVLGTALNLIFTLTSAYALSKRHLVGRNFFMLMITFTLYFNGGLIPTYLLIMNLNMLNTLWVMLIPGLVGVTNLIIARTFFMNSIPQELEDSAMIDGASNTRTFLTIVLPLSMPVIAVMALYYSLSRWNAYFNALIYLSDRSRYPLQLILREILVENQTRTQLMITGVIEADEYLSSQMRLASLIRYSVIIVSSAPIIAVYPFIQKYFSKGVMIGAIKG